MDTLAQHLATFGYIVAALVMLGVLIMMHEAGHFFVARWCGIEVKEFSIGMGPKIWSRKGKEGTVFSLRLLPLGGFCLYYGEDQEVDDPRAYNNKPVWKRFLSVLAGPGMNFLIAMLVAVIFFMVWGPYVQVPTVGSMVEGSPAAAAGLELGDRILEISGKPISTPTQASELIRASEGSPVDFKLERNGEPVSVSIAPKYDEAAKAYLIGITFGAEQQPLALGPALSSSVTYCKDVVVMTYQALADLILRGKGTEELSGPVGIVNIIRKETQAGGLSVYLQLAVLISINLGFMNLLPIPGLDGSRLVFNIIEAIRRKPINRNVEGMIHFIGVVALLGVMLLFAYKDIAGIIGGK